MNFVIHVPIHLGTPISIEDPDVRGIRRLPGFLHLDRTSRNWYELAFEVEGGSHVSAADAAEESLVDYAHALDFYMPRIAPPVITERDPRPDWEVSDYWPVAR
jgi:hypothetical protein